MAKQKKPIEKFQLTDLEQENIIFSNVAKIIERRKFNAVSAANSQVILMFWEIGQYINAAILGFSRAEYGKKILSTVSTKLTANYGNSFVEANLYRMKRFATVFDDLNKIADVIPFLSWSHFCEIMRVKDEPARLFYAKDAAERQLGIRDLRRQIARKHFERQEIANTQLTENSAVPFNVFKDPYLLDVLDLKDNFLEADLENAFCLKSKISFSNLAAVLPLWNGKNELLLTATISKLTCCFSTAICAVWLPLN
ncbi:MAG: DUF1016 N-terminal domain-containing protein [Bacteroidales bacterium]|jgi:hypothetical protein|nr:DUF1016 N-terminal domain-containing protein [Bacteroidales bacterium]